MADTETKPTELNVQAFLNACTDDVRRTDAKALAELMRKVTGKEPAMWGPSTVGFDSYHYSEPDNCNLLKQCVTDGPF